MAGKKAENTKKVAGNAKKAEAAAQKQAVEDQKNSKAEEDEWSKGAKDNKKKAQADEKAAEAAKKKADKDALLAAEEASMPSKPKGAGAKKAEKKSKGTLDLSRLDAPSGALNASGIDNALDALSLTGGSGANDKIDKHPERRFKAALTVYQERRLEEMKDEKGLRRQQKMDQIFEEFKKSPENPYNQQLVGAYDISKEEAKELRQTKREQTESRLQNS